MAYTISISVNYGISALGLDLRARLVDTSGSDFGAEVSSGFSEIGAGNYLFTHEFPTGFRGGVKIYPASDSSDILFTAINQEEAELISQIVSEQEEEKSSTVNVKTKGDYTVVKTGTRESAYKSSVKFGVR